MSMSVYVHMAFSTEVGTLATHHTQPTALMVPVPEDPRTRDTCGLRTQQEMQVTQMGSGG